MLKYLFSLYMGHSNHSNYEGCIIDWKFTLITLFTTNVSPLHVDCNYETELQKITTLNIYT